MSVGTVLSTRYRLEREIGSGGIGTVYRATDLRTGATVAVKVLHPHLAKDPDFVRRFHRGARIARKLEDPNIVRVLDHGRDGGQQFLVMELVEGKTLLDVLSTRAKRSDKEARSIVRQVALALDAAHQQGVVHRDIKPGNILVTKDGVAKVTDFDIARAIDATRMTRTGLFMGSVRYAAPEAFSGRADIRSDIYSLGIVLYEMLTGRVPFDADTPLAVMEMHRTTEPPGLEQLDRLGEGTLAAVVQRCLEKRPEERFQDPRKLLLALEGRAAAEPRRPKAPPPGPRWPLPDWLRQPYARYVLAGSGAILAVVLALVGGNVLFSGGESTVGNPTPTPPPSSTAGPGEVVTEITVDDFIAPGRTTRGLAWDGAHLWLSADTELFKADADGEVVDSYSAPEVTPEGLTWDGETFWIFTTNKSDIHQFSIDDSADVSEPRIISSFRSPNQRIGGTYDGLAWDGTGLWYSDAESVYKLDTAGNVLSSFTFGHDIAGLAWDGERLWLAYNPSTLLEDATLVKTDTQGTILLTTTVPLSHIDALTWGDGHLWAAGADSYAGQPGQLGQQRQRMIYKIDLVTTVIGLQDNGSSETASASPVPISSSTPGDPQPGTYSGTTSQGRSVEFDVVEGRAIGRIKFDVEGECPGSEPMGCTCEVKNETTMAEPWPIADNAFSYAPGDFSFSAVFDSTTTASGFVRVHTAGSPGDQAPCNSDSVTWTASVR